MATPGSLKRPVGRPRKIPRTKEEEEEFKLRQMKAMAQRAARAQMMKDEDYHDEDDDDFDEEDFDDDDYDTDDGTYFDIRNSSRNRMGRPRIPKTPRIPDHGKQDKNFMCKPIMMTKATSCNPIRVGKITQTEFGDPDEKKIFIPVEFPLLVPTPMAFNAPTVPCFIPVPMTICIPNVTPMHSDAINKAVEELEKLYHMLPEDGEDCDRSVEDKKLADILMRLHDEVDRIDSQTKVNPSPLETENIVMKDVDEDKMEEDVKKDDDMQVDDNDIKIILPKVEKPQADEEQLNLESEPMLESENMETDDKQVGEDQLQQQQHPEQAHESLEMDDADVDIPAERLVHMQKIKNQSMVITQKQAILPQVPFRLVPLDDTHMKLKYSYGVKAYKYWAIKKNAELKAAWKEICQKDGLSIPPFKPVKNEILACSMSELSFYLGSFVNEITKPTGESYYPDTIFYFCLGIQYYISENRRSDDIFHDETFVEFYEVLNAKLIDSTLRTNSQGLTYCHVTEDHLWESRYLGAMTPYTLLETLVFLNTKNFLLSDVESHLGLSFSNVMKQWKKNVISSDGKPARTVYLKYNPFSTIQADYSMSGLAVEKKHRIDPNILYEQLENVENPLRCPVKMYEFYLSKCPDAIKHRNDVFYLQPEPCCVPSSPVWFSSNQLDQEVISMMITRSKVVREVQENFLSQRTMPSSTNTATTIHQALANGQAFYVA